MCVLYFTKNCTKIGILSYEDKNLMQINPYKKYVFETIYGKKAFTTEIFHDF
jgi:hypothetical protein